MMTTDRFVRKTVRLLPGHLDMQQELDMTLYVITGCSLERRNASNPGKGVWMKIVLKRKIANEMLCTYLPSIILLLITWATTFFKRYFFEAALSVNLTTLLVLTSIFISVMQNLPTTSYVKMIDFWLIYCQLIPFIEVILLTIMEWKRDGDGSGEEEPAPKPESKPSGAIIVAGPETILKQDAVAQPDKKDEGEDDDKTWMRILGE